MGNTKSGGQKVRETNIKKHGSEEAWLAFMRENAAKGGKISRGGGFADRELAARAGRIGGRISKRKSKKEQ